MDMRLLDALRVVGLDVHRQSADADDDAWYCRTPLGKIGPFRSEEWALVEGVRALTRYAAGQEAMPDSDPNPFERFLRDLDREQREYGEGT